MNTTKKGKGLLRRPNIDVEPKNPANPVTLDESPAELNALLQNQEIESSPNLSKQKTLKVVQDRTGKQFKNQTAQIKLSQGLKEEFSAIKTIRKVKFDYEMLEILIDSYIQQMDTVEQKKFKAMTEF